MSQSSYKEYNYQNEPPPSVGNTHNDNEDCNVIPLPCPFCGGEVSWTQVSDTQYYMQCYNDYCEVQPAINRPSDSAEKVIRRWNKRKE